MKGMPIEIQYPGVPDYVVGMKKHVATIKELLFRKPTSEKACSCLIGIHGMGGSGKTVLASVIFNDTAVASMFAMRSFVRLTMNPDIFDCQVQLYKQFIGCNVPEEFTQMRSCKKMAELLNQELRNQVVLLILDGMWFKDLDEIADLLVVNPSNGSRVIFTTRMEKIGYQRDRVHIYDIGLLNFEDSKALFGYHAGVKQIPMKDQPLLESDLNKVVNDCERLPIVLEVIGCLVSGDNPKNIKDWRRALRSMSSRLKHAGTCGKDEAEKMLCRLKLSYDNLDACQQQCFLHFGSIPPGYRTLVSDVVETWMSSMEGICEDRACGILKHLEMVSLVKIDEVGTCGYQSQDVELAFHSAGFRDDVARTCYVHRIMHELALYIIRTGDPGRWYWVDRSHSVQELFLSQPQRATASELSIWGMEVEELPSDMRLPRAKLVLLRHTGLQHVPAAICCATRLCVLDMSFSLVATLPGQLSSLKKLQILRLDACKKLTRLPDEIGSLGELRVLSLRFCTQLRVLPTSIWTLRRLNALYAPGCAFCALPAIPTTVVQLRNLDLGSCRDMVSLPDGISCLSLLEQLNLSGCWKLELIDPGVGKLQNLKNLFLACCGRIRELPSLAHLTSLEVLDVQLCVRLRYMPPDIGELLQLREIYMEFCKRLEGFPDEMDKLRSLKLLGLDTQTVRSSRTTQELVISEIVHCGGTHEGKSVFLKRGKLPTQIVDRIKEGDIQIQSRVLEHSIFLMREVCCIVAISDVVALSLTFLMFNVVATKFNDFLNALCSGRILLEGVSVSEVTVLPSP